MMMVLMMIWAWLVEHFELYFVYPLYDCLYLYYDYFVRSTSAVLYNVVRTLYGMVILYRT